MEGERCAMMSDERAVTSRLIRRRHCSTPGATGGLGIGEGEQEADAGADGKRDGNTMIDKNQLVPGQKDGVLPAEKSVLPCSLQQ